MAPGRTRRIRNDGNSAQALSTQEGPGGRSNNIIHPQVPNTQDGASGSGTKKNVRKKTVNNKLTAFLGMGGAKPMIEFEPELNVPLGPWAAEWSNELGVIARQHVPLSCHSWKDVKGPQKATIFEQVLKRFRVDFSDAHVVSAVDGHIKQLYKNYRYKLHSHYKSLADNVDQSQHPRKDVSQADWALLCAHWETDEFKKKSTTNKKSREAVKVLHRAGTKNYARHRFDLRDPETNEQPNSVSLYKSTHHSLKKGWVAPLAEENYENMTEMLSQPTEEGKERTPDEVRESVLGKRPGYACGLGYGYVVSTQRTAAAAAAATAAGAAATAVAREEMDQLRQRAETAENQLREVLAQQSNQQRLLEQVMSRLGGGFT